MAARQEPASYPPEWTTTPPWAFAAIGRASLLYGTEYRSFTLTEDRLKHLVGLYGLVYEEKPPGASVASLIAPLLYEQWPYAMSRKAEMARAYLLMSESVGGRTPMPSEAWLEVLGGELDEVIKATFLLTVGAQSNGGIFDPSWLQQDNFRDVNRLVAPEVVLATARRLTTTVAAAKADAAAAVARNVASPPGQLFQFAYNPLFKTPFVDLGQKIVVAPQHQLIIRTASPESLYYLAEGLGAGHSQYEPLPYRRDVIALVVTAEPIWLANTPEITDYLPSPVVPTVAISLHDVEQLANLAPDEMEAALRAVILDDERRGNVFHMELRKVLPTDQLGRRNQLIDDAFNRHLAPISRESRIEGQDPARES